MYITIRKSFEKIFIYETNISVCLIIFRFRSASKINIKTIYKLMLSGSLKLDFSCSFRVQSQLEGGDFSLFKDGWCRFLKAPLIG